MDISKDIPNEHKKNLEVNGEGKNEEKPSSFTLEIDDLVHENETTFE